VTQEEMTELLEQGLGTLSSVYMGKAAESDLYEATLFTLGVLSCRIAGGQIFVENATPVIFRTSPGQIWSDTYTRAVAEFSGRPMVEVHLGVKIAGASGVHHEVDVALIDATEAARCRGFGVPPRRGKLVYAVEAKHYDRSPGIGIGRGFIGLANELYASRCGLAFPEPGSASLLKLLARKQCEVYDESWPGSRSWGELLAAMQRAVKNWVSAA
jgi:hypothetical protein